MTSKPSSKKPASKKTPAKKGSTKKKPASKSIKKIEPTEAQAKIEKAVNFQTPNPDTFLKASPLGASIVKANDVKSPSLRKRMLAWFTIYK